VASDPHRAEADERILLVSRARGAAGENASSGAFVKKREVCQKKEGKENSFPGLISSDRGSFSLTDGCFVAESPWGMARQE
jgi:hypothetical protein